MCAVIASPLLLHSVEAEPLSVGLLWLIISEGMVICSPAPHSLHDNLQSNPISWCWWVGNYLWILSLLAHLHLLTSRLKKYSWHSQNPPYSLCNCSKIGRRPPSLSFKLNMTAAVYAAITETIKAPKRKIRTHLSFWSIYCFEIPRQSFSKTSAKRFGAFIYHHRGALFHTANKQLLLLHCLGLLTYPSAFLVCLRTRHN